MVQVIPNPCRNLVLVVSHEQVRRAFFIDSTGKTVLCQEVPNGRIRVDALSAGTYTVNIEHNNSVITTLELVKE